MNEQKESRRSLRKAVVNGLWGMGIGSVTAGVLGGVSDEFLAPEGLSASAAAWAICWIAFCTGMGSWFGWTGRSVLDWWRG